MCLASKNQNPREGIETGTTTYTFPNAIITSLQKTKIPARGLKPCRREGVGSVVQGLQKTKIPARGLKPLGRKRMFDLRNADRFKKPKSPRGD